MLARMRVIDLLIPAAPPLCVACGGWARAAEPLCAPCRRQLTWLGPDLVPIAPGVDAWAPLAYAGPAQAAVTALKFRGAAGVADAMAAQVVANAPAGWLDAVTLVPAPLHPARIRRRGFNQAERLARAIARRAGVPVADLLARAGPRATQMGRGRAERLTGIAGAIALRPEARALPGRILLIDDVITTGATLAACTETLGQAGASEIAAIAYARTPGR
jgi:competence protein ComFC